MTASRLREVGSVTSEALERLHKQLETCPSPEQELADPDGLAVPLMAHQRQALAWLTWRENQHPAGGILGNTNMHLLCLLPFHSVHVIRDILP